MAEQVIIEFVGDTSKLEGVYSELSILNDEQKQLFSDVKATQAAYNKSLQDTAKSVKSLGAAEKQAAGEAKQLSDQFKNITDKTVETALNGATEATKELTSEVNKQVTAQKSLKAQLKDLKAQIAVATDPEEVRRLTVAAGELSDQIADINDKVARFAVDSNFELALNGMVDIAGGAVGAFSALQGSFALFGGQTEELQKTLVQLNGAMAILQGVTQVQNVLKKESAAVTLIEVGQEKALALATQLETAAKSENIIVSKAAIITQRALNVVMAANPVMLLVGAIAAVTAGLYLFINSTDKAAESQRTLNDLLEAERNNITEYIALIQKSSDAIVQSKQRELEVAKSQGKSANELRKIELDIAKSQEEAAKNAANIRQADLIDFQNNRKKYEDIVKESAYKVKLLEGKVAGGDESDKTKLLLENAQKEYAISKANYDELDNLDKSIKETQTNRTITQLNHQKAAQEEYLNAITKNYELQAEQSVKFSQQELNARIAGINAKAKQDKEALANDSSNATQRALIEAKANKDIADLRQEYAVKDLQERKAIIDNQLIQVRKGSQDELNLKIQSIQEQAKINTESLKNDKYKVENQKNIEATAAKEIADLKDEFAYNQRIKEQNVVLAKANAVIAIEKDGSQKVFEAKRTAIEAESQLQLIQVQQSEQNEELLSAKIVQINAEKNQQLKLLDEERSQNTINEIYKTLDASQQRNVSELRLIKNNIRLSEAQRSQANIKELQEQLKTITLKQQQLTTLYNSDEISYEQYQKELTRLSQEGAVKRGEIDNAEFDERKKKEQETQEYIKAAKVGAVQIAQTLSDQAFQFDSQKRQSALDEELSSLEEQKNNALLNTQLTEAQRAAIQEQFRRKEAQAKERAWKADQDAKISQAIINGFLGFTASIAQQGIPAGLITGAVALAQAGIMAGFIGAQKPPKFAKGTKGNKSLPEGFSIVGEEGAELIWTKGGGKVITAPDTQKILSNYNIPSINEDVEPMARQYALQKSISGENNIDLSALGKIIGNELAKQPRKETVINLDKSGFTSFHQEKGMKITYVNNRFTA